MSTFSLSSDLHDVAVLATPTAAAYESYFKIVASVAGFVTAALPNHRVLPYGSFSTGLMLSHTSDLDFTVVGPEVPRSVAATVAGAMRSDPAFETSVRPDHFQHPLVRFHHLPSCARGDITFNQFAAVRASGLISAAAQRYPIAARLAILVKAACAGAGIGLAFNSVSVAVTCFGFYASALADTVPGISTTAPLSLSAVFLAYADLLGADDTGHAQLVFTLTGVTVRELPNGPCAPSCFVADPVDPTVNLAERCSQFFRFRELMRRTSQTIRVHYTGENFTRPSGSAHLLHLVPAFDHTSRFTRPLAVAGESAVPPTKELAMQATDPLREIRQQPSPPRPQPKSPIASHDVPIYRAALVRDKENL
jgi:hypothetical protein